MNKELINLKNKLNALGETKEASYLGGFVKEANDVNAFIAEILTPLSEDGYVLFLETSAIGGQTDPVFQKILDKDKEIKGKYQDSSGTQGYINLYLTTNDTNTVPWDDDNSTLTDSTKYNQGDAFKEYHYVYDDDWVTDDDLYVVLDNLSKDDAGRLIDAYNQNRSAAARDMQEYMDVINDVTGRNYTMDGTSEQIAEEQTSRSTQTSSSSSGGAPPPVTTRNQYGSDVVAPPFSGESGSRSRQAPAQTRSQPSSPPAISGCSKTERNNLSLVDVASRGGYFQKCQESPHIKQIQDLLKFFGANINDKPGLFGEDTKTSIQNLTGKSGEIIGEDELVEIAIRAAQQGRGKLLTHVIAPSNWEQIVKDQRFRDLYKERGQKGRQFRRLIRKNLRNNGIYGIQRFRAWLRKNKAEDDTGSQFDDDSF